MQTNQYRVVTDGREYFLEQFSTCRFLWWRWERWNLVGVINVSTDQNIWVPLKWGAEKDAAAYKRKMESQWRRAEIPSAVSVVTEGGAAVIDD